MEGMLCVKCHHTKPLTMFGNDRSRPSGKYPYCKICVKQLNAANYIKFGEAIRAQVRRYDRENAAKVAEKKRLYRQQTQAIMRVYLKEYRIRKQQELAPKERAYRQRNKVRIYARQRVWAKQHPEKVKANAQRRRARKACAPLNDFTAAQWREMQAHYGYRCVYCGKKCQTLTQDHITPLSKGGSHTKSNIVPACKSCNSQKHAGAPLRAVQPLLL